MRKVLVPLGVALATIAALAGGAWAWLRRRPSEPVAELPPAGGTTAEAPPEPAAEPVDPEPAGETAYARELEAEAAERRAAAERLKNDPLTARLSGDAENQD